MKNIARLFLILFVTSVVFSSCEDEDVQRFPDFVVPVVLLAQNPSDANFVIPNLDTESYSFTLNYENFDGSADGHKFFVDRSGTHSSLIDATLMVSYNGGDAVDLGTFQESEFPVNVVITPSQLAGLFGVSTGDFADGDAVVISYLYRINPNNAGGVRELGTPGADYCGGFTNEGEFCSLAISFVSE